MHVNSYLASEHEANLWPVYFTIDIVSLTLIVQEQGTCSNHQQLVHWFLLLDKTVMAKDRKESRLLLLGRLLEVTTGLFPNYNKSQLLKAFSFALSLPTECFLQQVVFVETKGSRRCENKTAKR